MSYFSSAFQRTRVALRRATGMSMAVMLDPCMAQFATPATVLGDTVSELGYKLLLLFILSVALQVAGLAIVAKASSGPAGAGARFLLTPEGLLMMITPVVGVAVFVMVLMILLCWFLEKIGLIR